MSAFALNTPLASTVTFREEALPNDLIDPTVVKFFMRRPGQAVQTYVFGTDVEVTNPSIGVYKFEWTANDNGRWVIAWEGSDPDEDFHARTPDETIFIRGGLS